MRSEVRFLLAVGLMLLVLVGTNRLFPPIVPEEDPAAAGDSTAVAAGGGEAASGGVLDLVGGEDPGVGAAAAPATPAADEAEVGSEVLEVPIRDVVVVGPRYTYAFTTEGARMVSGELTQFVALNRDGPVQVVPEGAGSYLGQTLVVGEDTLDMSSFRFQVEPETGLALSEGDAPQALRFWYEHPTSDFRFEVSYTFDPDDYGIGVSGSVQGLDRSLLVTDLGEGLAYAEKDSALEARSMAYVKNHLQDGVVSTLLSRGEVGLEPGPLLWAAFRSKFFVIALLGGESEEAASEATYLGGLFVRQGRLPERVRVGVAQSVPVDGTFRYRLYLGPQEYATLSSLGQDMEEVNPYGWRVFRPIIRPIVGVIMAILVFLHENLSLSYGWVLVVFGVAMRVVLFPLNHKAMRAQLRNMAVQPLLKEIQEKHKENPEKLQKEMMRLHREHGFNPLAGCLPMLLPWPVLIALFFVFQNTIELRGVPFLWLPDLSAKDPFYILPVILGISMFLMQWISLRSLDQENPQMKMMMYIMPPMMLFIFLNLASGLNLYYATANIATLPQQIWIANERKKMQGKPPLSLSRD